jgi:hypothetical protein
MRGEGPGRCHFAASHSRSGLAAQRFRPGGRNHRSTNQNIIVYSWFRIIKGDVVLLQDQGK